MQARQLTDRSCTDSAVKRRSTNNQFDPFSPSIVQSMSRKGDCWDNAVV